MEDLIDAWWSMAEAMGAVPPAPQALIDWHGWAFVRVLEQCGWTIAEWDAAVETSKGADGA